MTLENGRHGSYAAQFQALIDELEGVRDERSLMQIQRIIDFADAHNDQPAVIEWLVGLLDAASHFGRYDIKLQAFTRLRDLYRSEPDAEDLRTSVLWYWKWLHDDLAQFVEVPAEQIDALQSQMEAFYREEGESLAPVYSIRYATAAFMGRSDEAAVWLERLEACDSGESDDCIACQINTRVGALLNLDRIDDALEAATPLIRGEHSCEQVPASTFSRLLLPLLFQGEASMCVSMMATFRRQVRSTPGMFEYLADHLLFLSLVPSPQTARRHASIALRRLGSTSNANAYQRFCNARACWVWAHRRRASGRTLDLPRRSLERLPCDSDDDSVVAWLESQMLSLAAAFDARNVSDRFERLVASAAELIEMPTVEE